MTWTPVPVPHPPYVCFELDRFVREVGGFDTGPLYIELTYGGGHSSTSAHYPANGARARDFWGDYIAIAHWLEPLAMNAEHGGSDVYLIEELFCPAVAVAWDHGAPSGFVDNAGHTHAALRPGAVLPWPAQRKDEPMGAYAGESVHPGERKTFGITEPSSVMPGGLHLADTVLIHIPFDAYDDPAHPNPGKFRWAIVDKSGKWIDGNGAEGDIHTGGVEIVAHPGAFALSVENHMTPADGRIIGPPVFKWGYA